MSAVHSSIKTKDCCCNRIKVIKPLFEKTSGSFVKDVHSQGRSAVVCPMRSFCGKFAQTNCGVSARLKGLRQLQSFFRQGGGDQFFAIFWTSFMNGLKSKSKWSYYGCSLNKKHCCLCNKFKLLLHQQK